MCRCLSVDGPIKTWCLRIESPRISRRRLLRCPWTWSTIWLYQWSKCSYSGNWTSSSDGRCWNRDASRRYLRSWEIRLSFSDVNSGSDILLVDVCDSIWSICLHHEIKVILYPYYNIYTRMPHTPTITSFDIILALIWTPLIHPSSTPQFPGHPTIIDLNSPYPVPD